MDKWPKWLPAILFVAVAGYFIGASGGARSAALTPVVVSGGSDAHGGGDFFPTSCDGNIYKLVAKTVNAYVVKAYMFIASPAPAMDAWLYTDFDWIIGEVHAPTSVHPVSGLRYWESERTFGVDAIWVGTVWILVMCYPQGGPTSIEPYAILYTRKNP